MRVDNVKLPGKLILQPGVGAVTIQSKTGWKTEIMEELVTLPNIRWGAHNQVLVGRVVKITGQPTGFTGAGLAKLFTHGSVRMGGSIVGSADKVAELHTVDGKKRTIACYVIQQEPAMTLFPGQTILGEVVIYGIVPDNGTGGSLSELYAQSNAAWTDDDWDQLSEITPGWTVAWINDPEDSTQWANIEVLEPGATVTPKPSLKEDKSMRGLVNITISDYYVEAGLQAMNISETQVLAALGSNLKPGQSKLTLARTLKFNATDGSAFIRVNGALMQPTSFTYDAENYVASDLKWRSFPPVVNGVRAAHLLVTTVNPDA